jgi:hypothetical protein
MHFSHKTRHWAITSELDTRRKSLPFMSMASTSSSRERLHFSSHPTPKNAKALTPLKQNHTTCIESKQRHPRSCSNQRFWHGTPNKPYMPSKTYSNEVRPTTMADHYLAQPSTYITAPFRACMDEIKNCINYFSSMSPVWICHLFGYTSPSPHGLLDVDACGLMCHGVHADRTGR